jgi:hypothetical protein
MDCALCGLNAEAGNTTHRTVEIRCPKCGHYERTGSVKDELSSVPLVKRLIISSWVWEQNRFGNVPTITNENLGGLLTLPPLTFFEKAKRLLVYVAERTPRLGLFVEFKNVELQAMLQAQDNHDVGFIAQFLMDKHFLQQTGSAGLNYMITADGLLKADEWRASATAGTQGFIAMWFDKSTDEAYESGLFKGIQEAGYKPLRIDMKEHANKICDEMISEIRRSRFLVADLTNHRPNVYYEAGYAAGHGIPVFWTCRKDHTKDQHFDIRQYNCIDWVDPKELADRLKVRIEAVLGDGPFKLSAER